MKNKTKVKRLLKKYKWKEYSVNSFEPEDDTSIYIGYSEALHFDDYDKNLGYFLCATDIKLYDHFKPSMIVEKFKLNFDEMDLKDFEDKLKKSEELRKIYVGRN